MTDGRYRIRAVSEMTGINAATLRAWERRYGVPVPKRTESAYRLYSDDDVALIRRMKDLVDAGMAPAQAAGAALEVHQQVGPPEGAEDIYKQRIDRLLKATRAFDVEGVKSELAQVLALGSARTIFDRVLGPALEQIGQLWHDGEISVGHEHMASELIGNATRQLLALVQPSETGRRALLACFDGEQHVIPLYGVALTLAEWGYQTVILGTSIPPAGLGVAIRSLQPQLVGLTVTVPPSKRGVQETLAAYAEACAGIDWVVGGSGAESIREAIEAAGGWVAGTDVASLKPSS